MKKALIVVDIQNDFCKGGSLEISDAEEIIPYVNQLMETQKYDEVVFTQDFHPKDHRSFASNNNRKVGEMINLNGIQQIMWPDHCIQGSLGAEFHKDLKRDFVTYIVKKGMNREVDSYSAFFDNQYLVDTGLSNYLKNNQVEFIEVVGLALDYCVKYTCLDAVKEGFKTSFHLKGTKAVNIHPKDAEQTVFQLIEKGISIIE